MNYNHRCTVCLWPVVPGRLLFFTGVFGVYLGLWRPPKKWSGQVNGT